VYPRCAVPALRESLLQAIETALRESLRSAGWSQTSDSSPPEAVVDIEIERPRVAEHGDFSTNVALKTSKLVGRKPREWAEEIAAKIALPAEFESIETAGPGFINFSVRPSAWSAVAAEVLRQASSYGRIRPDTPLKVNLEFVSANPTGPMHLGHARWAAWGDALGRLLETAGYQVTREFYINDAGNQMDLLGRSLAARYLQACGRDAEFPEDGYRGNYLFELADKLKAEVGEAWLELDPQGLSKACSDWACAVLLREIELQLARLGVRFDVWASEKALRESGKVEAVIEELRRAGLAYESEGAIWFKSTELGDEKDRVLVKSDGQPTYLATDIAYHIDKFSRGFDIYIDIWGADHAGHVPKLRAALQALGQDVSKLEILLGQLVSLSRAGEPVRLSKREGELFTFEELVDELGKDAARFHFLMQGPDSALNIDLEQAVEQSLENPVYYVQYAHARMRSIERKARAAGIPEPAAHAAESGLLVEPEEIALLKRLEEYPYLVRDAAELRAPHKLTQWARDLAADFHAFYHEHRVIDASPGELRDARLALVAACRLVLASCLDILGVEAPEEMERLVSEGSEGEGHTPSKATATTAAPGGDN
jgi:arginyl-tRNA synthetase